MCSATNINSKEIVVVLYYRYLHFQFAQRTDDEKMNNKRLIKLKSVLYSELHLITLIKARKESLLTCARGKKDTLIYRQYIALDKRRPIEEEEETRPPKARATLCCRSHPPLHVRTAATLRHACTCTRQRSASAARARGRAYTYSRRVYVSS